MANEIFTRLQLKYDTLANWNLVKDTFKPLAGEVCIAKVEVNDPANKLLDPVMIKVGDGTSTWGQLDWISAKAADVYAWAKKAGIDVEVVDVEGNPAEGNPDGYEHVEYPIVNFAWDSANNKLIATKGVIDANAVYVKGTGSGFSVEGTLTEALSDIWQEIWNRAWAAENAQRELAQALSALKDNDGSKVLQVTEFDDGDSFSAIKAQAVDIAITHDQVTDFDTEVKSIAADEINRLINASDPEGGKTIQDIENLVKYVDENAGEIAGLITDVETANTNASNAVTTANGAAETAGQALAKANDALEGATGAANSAAAAKASEDAAKASENAAAGSANAAAASAVTAGEKATAAAGSADSAAASAAAASASEQAAGQAKLGAETAKGLAEDAKNAAVAAQGLAEGARDAAIEAKNGADAAKGLADEAKNAAITAQGKAEEAQGAAEGFANDAGNAKTAAETAQAKAEAAQAAAEDANAGAIATANEAKGIADAAKEASDAATEAVSGLEPIAFSGSIYDVAEGSKVSTGTDTNVKYLVFNCGTASTVI